MNPRNSTRPPDDWMDDRVEAYVDGSLPPDEAARFEAVLDTAPHWKMQVRHAERIRTTLSERTLPSCPPECTEAILDQTVRASSQSQAPAVASSAPVDGVSWLDQVANALRVLTQPAYSTVLAAILVAALAWLIADPIVNDTTTEPSEPTASHIEAPYTDEDVARAQAEAEWALAYISDVSQDASTTAGREMERALSPFFNTPDGPSSSTP